MPAHLTQQEYENGMLEAACPQAISARLSNSGGVGVPSLHPGYFLKWDNGNEIRVIRD
jgi:hypothetical protein